ncbi:aBC transporter permease protein [Clostridium sp. CAG:557]|nr:aBC transporter permease protein [Clostridium sp. CAG:557]
MKLKSISKLYMGLIFFFLYSPLVVLIAFSFNESKSRNVWTGFSLKWYANLFADKEILRALFNTIVVAVIASVLATIIGTIACFGILKMKKWTKKFIMNVNNLPIVNPEIVTGVSLMLLFVFTYNTFGIFRPGILTLILSHTTFCLPYVVLSVLPKLRQINPYLYEAAQDLGCTPSRAFFKVILPDIMPGIVTGMIMAFTLSLDDFVISYFTSGTTQNLPIAIYSMTRKIVSPEINALSTILFAVVLFLLLVVNIRQTKYLSKKD